MHRLSLMSESLVPGLWPVTHSCDSGVVTDAADGLMRALSARTRASTRCCSSPVSAFITIEVRSVASWSPCNAPSEYHAADSTKSRVNPYQVICFLLIH